MKIIDKAVCGMKTSAQRLLRSFVSAEALVRGEWTARNDSPSQLLDPGKFKWYADNNVLLLPSRFDRGVITRKELRAYELILPAISHEFSRALDSLVAGGGLRWATDFRNLVVNEGLDDLLDVTLSGATQDTAWFVFLLAASPSPLASWTATEIGTNDFVNYDEATLQAWTDGGVSSQSVDNSASTADYTISTNGSSIGGAGLIGTDAKATPAGQVYAAGAFTGGNKAADDGDTLSVTSTYTTAAA